MFQRDGGMVCFGEAELDAAGRSFAWMGISESTYSRITEDGYRWSYDLGENGYKYHGNSISASLAMVALKYLDDDNQTRRVLSQEYAAFLRDEAAIELIPQPADCLSSRHLFQIKVEQRDRLIVKLRDHDIQAGVHYTPLTMFKEFRSAQAECPHAERAFQKLISLPLHLRMNKASVARVCDVVIAHARGL
jgi:dTDP-4-amino-4,6-dideoxygalactose transaminase